MYVYYCRTYEKAVSGGGNGDHPDSDMVDRRSAASGNRTQLSSVTGWHTTDILTRLGPTFGL